MKSGMPAANRIDWGRIAEPAARALMGDPNPGSTARELRFGRKGSLSVVIKGNKEGQWFDHEAGKGGGVIDLVQHVQSVDRAGAVDWLEREGFIEGDTDRRLPGTDTDNDGDRHRRLPGTDTSSDDHRRRPAPAATPTATTKPLVASVIAGTTDATDTIGHRYLTGRLAWPPAGIGPPLPPTVRWLPTGAARRAGAPLPDGAVGALVFVWHRPGEFDGDPCAVSLMAIDGDAVRVLWWNGQRTIAYGERRDAVCITRRGERDEPLHVVEGEADAVALAIAPWIDSGTVAAVGGTAGMKNAASVAALADGSAVVIHADGDKAGRQAAVALAGSLTAHGIKRRIDQYADGEDPAGALAGWIGEWAAIREYDGMECDAAERMAWMDLLTHEVPTNDER